MKRKGLTLLEAIISLFLLTIIISLVSLYQLNTTHLLKETKLKRLIEMQMSIGLDEISREIKHSTEIIEAEKHRLTLYCPSFNVNHKEINKTDDRTISYFIGTFNQSFARDYELPKFCLMRSENYKVQPIVYYFGDDISSLVFTYYDKRNDEIEELTQSNLEKIRKIKVEINTTTFQYKQKIHKEMTICLNRGM